MKNTYKFEIHGKTGNGNTYTTSGEVSGNIGAEWDMMIPDILKQSFQQLTGGKAVFGKPGIGCRGPYSITHLILSNPEVPVPFHTQMPGRITSIDSLRLAARGLADIADDFEAIEKLSKDAKPFAEILGALKTLPPLVSAVVDNLSARLRASRGIHPAIQAAQPLTNEGLPQDYEPSAIPPGQLGDSTNPPADQVGSQTTAADASPASEPVADPAPESQPVSDAEQTADNSGDSREGL